MPQRAVIYEESGKRDVHAYDLSDEHWYGVIEAAEAKTLKLPCCGVDAKPRNPENMVRHFAHPPYTLDHCQAKKTGNGHDAIIAAVASVAKELGWIVTTEVKFKVGFCDVICERPKSGLRIGFEFETGIRPNQEIEAIDLRLSNKAVHQLHWFFKKGRHGGAPNVQYSQQFRASDQVAAIADITVDCKKILSDIEQTVRNANEVIQSLKENNIPFELLLTNHVPDRILAFPEGKDRPHIVKIGPDQVEVEHPETLVHQDNIEKGECTARAQESLINMIRKNLKRGEALWWKGHPALLCDSFKALREAIERDQQHRQILAEQLQRQRGVQATSSGENRVILPAPWQQNEEARAPAKVTEQRQPAGSEEMLFADMRLKEIAGFLKFHYGYEFTTELLGAPMEELGGQSPKDIVTNTSQSLEVIQVALGYRDPISKVPLRHIPAVKLGE